ncbi:allantoinase AllB [Micromonospora sp. DR5-3]|uniref:allantoinase AllB n=1 Tax=unclassified Micromonospora TaxID=2617518 RepID=UPI001CA31426|nr:MULTISPECIES: allantoinase AllB [unclassified Micromonospora]MCW3818788.1 allantoinase AllB [Micromonospora sp. DR5-3]
MLDTVFKAARVVTPDGERTVDVGVKDGVIAAVEPDLEAPRVVRLGTDEVLLPGLVDTHVHVNEPGRTEWEGFASATRAAAAGGVTTIVDMPLNSIPPTIDVVALELKRKAAAGQCFVDVGFWGGAVPGNLPGLRRLHDEGVFGFKCFLVDSGVEEFPHLRLVEVEQVMRELAPYDGLLVVHAEDADRIAPAPASRKYADFLASRPRSAEDHAIAEVLALSQATGCRVHILHLSSSDAVPLLRQARADGVRVTVETCPHYLSFDAEHIGDGATQFKCCPPIREGANRDALWQALRDGVIDLVVSDHSPSTAELKSMGSGDFDAAWGGISSLQLGLSIVWTEAWARGFDLTDVVRWMAHTPARMAGMRHKGGIAVGNDADFCVVAPEQPFTVEVARLHHKNAVTPYDGRELVGVVRSTWLRGERIDLGAEPPGRFLRKGTA